MRKPKPGGLGDLTQATLLISAELELWQLDCFNALLGISPAKHNLSLGPSCKGDLLEEQFEKKK